MDKKSPHNLSAKIVLDNTDITYRQLNDWENKGFLKPLRTNKRGWRRFTSSSYFSLLIYSKLKSLGIQPRTCKWIVNEIPRKTYLEYAASIYLMGMRVSLMTDLKTYAHISGPLDSQDFSEATRKDATIHIDLSPLIEKLFITLGVDPVPQETKWEINMNNHLRNTEDIVVRSIRSKKYDEISLTKQVEGWKLKGKRYLEKNIQNEILTQKNAKKSSRITTQVDKHGKITTASIEEIID